MEINIIDYTPEQYAALSSNALEKIRQAQQKKDALAVVLEQKLLAEKQKLMDRGVYLSNIWSRLEEEMRARHAAEVQTIKENLVFYLHYSKDVYKEDVGEGGTVDVPYPVDYSYTLEERMTTVQEYYLAAYSNPTERFDVFKADTFARSYLGELYAPLWHYFENLA